MSKAQEKREKRAKETLKNKINFILRDFKNKYFEAYCFWNNRELEKRLKSYRDLLNEIEPLVGLIHPRYKGGVKNHHIKELKWSIGIYEQSLDRPFTNNYEWCIEADKTYNQKLNKMIDKLIQENFLEGINFDEIKTQGDELSFLVTDHKKDRECYARAIFVNGEIKAPHYRFITTVRALKFVVN